MGETEMHSWSLSPRHLGFSCLPTTWPGQPLCLLKPYLSINLKGPPSFKKSPEHPQEDYVLFPTSALRLASVCPLANGVTWVRTQALPAHLGCKLPSGGHVFSMQMRCSTWRRPRTHRSSTSAQW